MLLDDLVEKAGQFEVVVVVVTAVAVTMLTARPMLLVFAIQLSKQQSFCHDQPLLIHCIQSLQ